MKNTTKTMITIEAHKIPYAQNEKYWCLYVNKSASISIESWSDTKWFSKEDCDFNTETGLLKMPAETYRKAFTDLKKPDIINVCDE